VTLPASRKGPLLDLQGCKCLTALPTGTLSWATECDWDLETWMLHLMSKGMKFRITPPDLLLSCLELRRCKAQNSNGGSAIAAPASLLAAHHFY